MRKFLCACFITIILCAIVYANAASDLQKLQPLTKEELLVVCQVGILVLLQTDNAAVSLMCKVRVHNNLKGINEELL